MVRQLFRPESRQRQSVLAIVIVLVVVVVALYWARVIIMPFALAVFFTFVLAPLVVTLQRRGLHRVPSVILVVGVALIAFGVVGFVVGRQVVQLTRSLPDHAERIKSKLSELKRWLPIEGEGRLAGLMNDVSDTFANPKAGTAQDTPGSQQTVVLESAPSWVVHAEAMVSPAAEALGQAAFTFILVVFMLLRREDLRNRLVRLVSQGRVTTTSKAIDETSRRISRYLFAQFLLNASFGLIIALGLFLMGVPYSPVWAFTAFLMRYVPYIGTWIGVIPPALFTFAVSDGWGLTLGVFALFFCLEAVCNNVFEPLLYGSRLGLSPVAQLVATAFWAFLWGPVGMVLAWPLTTCLLMVGKYVPRLQVLTVLLGDEPVLSPRVVFFQRLAARDHDEAADIVEKELARQSTEKVFDDILIPALTEARKDVRRGLLSDEDLVSLTASIREIAEELAEFRPGETPAADAVAADRPVLAGAPARVRALLVPAKDIVDLTAIQLFGRLLDPGQWDVDLVSASTLTSELLTRTEESRPAVVIIGSVPPGGLTHTRSLCKRIHQRFPAVKIIVGRWTASDEDPATFSQPLRDAGADEVTVSLEETRGCLYGWRVVFAAAPAIGQPEVGMIPA
jgi:predicted PurR-regulated permease PerM